MVGGRERVFMVCTAERPWQVWGVYSTKDRANWRADTLNKLRKKYAGLVTVVEFPLDESALWLGVDGGDSWKAPLRRQYEVEPQKVWVVVRGYAEGEYRSLALCGVFLTKEEAEARLAEVKGAYSDWTGSYERKQALEVIEYELNSGRTKEVHYRAPELLSSFWTEGEG